MTTRPALPSTPRARPRFSSPFVRESCACLLLAATIVSAFSFAYHRSHVRDWSIPITYSGDAWLGMALVKAYQDGEILPVGQQKVRRLNAPFTANWNDWPMTEDCLFWMTGVAARLVGLCAALNLALLAAHLLAGLSFYTVARLTGTKIVFALTGAVAFALSNFIFSRSIPHIVLSYYWHAPLCLLVTWWILSGRCVPNTWKWWVSVGIAVVAGIANPYYSNIFLQLLGFTVLALLVRRRWSEIPAPIVLGVIVVAGFLLMNSNTLTYQWQHGANRSVVQRNLAGLELYGLVPVELFLPVHHRWNAFANFAKDHYRDVALFRGEVGSPYLGLLGIAGLLWLAGLFIYRVLSGRASLIPVSGWQTLWILCYSSVGGVNLALGICGVMLFRATNRLSVFLLAISLLFLVKQLSRKCRRFSVLVAICLVLIALWDQLPARADAREKRAIASRVASDHQFARSMEDALGKNAMVFELPVMDFPEVPPVLGVQDYEHFRPYLFSHDLRFSYGSDKGRNREHWQREVEQLPPLALAKRLETYGFSAIMMNLKGYPDGGNRFLQQVQEAGIGPVLYSGTKDLAAVVLHPVLHPEIPPIQPALTKGFYGWESGPAGVIFSWTSGDASMTFDNDSDYVQRRVLSFDLQSLRSRSVTVISGQTKTLFKLEGASPLHVNTYMIDLQPGQNVVSFQTDTPAALPPNGDPRPLAFSIANLAQHDL